MVFLNILSGKGMRYLHCSGAAYKWEGSVLGTWMELSFSSDFFLLSLCKLQCLSAKVQLLTSLPLEEGFLST